ncbi:hypothetical protein [Nonomuraea antri]|uniref:hypothetical protein n=1 Tax=Nonomuraea antri TaxID=2730852 RepID=UPI001C2C2B3E|nr:hypothetical protein [Nonomuraea antri]
MTSTLTDFIDAMIDLGITGQIFGAHGIGKTSTFFSHLRGRYRLVYVPAANLTPDDLLVNAPVRQDGELVLRQLIMRQLKPGRPFVLLIDDSLQAGDTIQAQLMQIACSWTLGEHDLRALGCAGVFLTDNESLAETAARRSDLAILDRMATVRITAADTGWRRALARKFGDVDLSGSSASGPRCRPSCVTCSRRARWSTCSTARWPGCRRTGGCRWSTAGGCA